MDELDEDGVSPGARGRGRRDISGDFGRIGPSVACRCDPAWENFVGVVGRLATCGVITVGAEMDAWEAVVLVEPLLSFLAGFRGRGFGTTTGCDVDVVTGDVSSLWGFSGGTGGPLAAVEEFPGLVLGLGLATGGILGFSAGSSDTSGVEFLLFRFGRGGWEVTFSYRGPFAEVKVLSEEMEGGVPKRVDGVGSRGTNGGESLWADEGVGLRLFIASGALVSRFI